MKNKHIFLICIISSFILLILTHIFSIGDYIDTESFKFNSSIFEPLLPLFVALAICAGVLQFLSDPIFKMWFKRIFVWFLPIGLFVTFVSDVYGNYAQPGRTEIATLLGVILVLVTLGFALAQKFYYKK